MCSCGGLEADSKWSAHAVTLQISLGPSLLEQVGFVEALYNTRLSDQDEVKLRHAPCPVKDAMGTRFCVFFGVVAVLNTNVGFCTSTQTVCLAFPCACFMLEIQTVKPKNTTDCQRALLNPVSRANVCCIIWPPFQTMLLCH